MTYETETETEILDALEDDRPIDGETPREMRLRALRARGDRPTVYEALGAAKRQIDAVPKTSSSGASERGEPGVKYKFRGIEAILNACHRATAEHGILCVPTDGDLETWPWYGYGSSDADKERNSKSWRLYRLEVLWKIYGPAGDYLEVRNYGEALDNADKALGKARSYAQKDLYIRIFDIPTDDPDMGDTENTVPPADAPPVKRATVAETEAIRDVVAGLLERTGGYPRLWKEAEGWAAKDFAAALAGEKDLPTSEWVDRMHALAAEWKARADERDAAARAEVEQPELGQDRESYSDDQDRDSYTVSEPDTNGKMIEAPGGRPDSVTPDISRLRTAEETAELRTSDGPCTLCGSTRTNRALVDGVWRCQDPKGCEERATKRAAERAAAETVSDASEDVRPDCAAGDGPIDGEPVTIHDDETGEDLLFHADCIGMGEDG